jgi:tetratricopeptide (TPR) repeat protein
MVRERTAGNPFFLEEVVLSLVEAGNLAGEHGAYRLVRPVEEAAVPASVQAVLAARIDRLSERDKGVLQAAAVIGREFLEPVLARVVTIDRPDLEDAIAQLVASEFIFEQELYPDVVYAFRHPLTREVAYGSQLAARRATVHAAVAGAMEAEHPERLDEWAATLAQHWESAERTLEAARWHARAAGWAGSNDPVASLEHWRRVRELGDATPDSAEARQLALAARIFGLGFGWRLGIPDEEADTLFHEAERMAAQANDVWARTLLLTAYSTLTFTTRGEIQAATKLARDALSLAEESGDRALYLAASAASYVFFLIGSYNECIAICDRAIELADGDASVGAQITNECPLAQCLMQKGGSLIDLGRLDEAAEVIDRGTRLAAERGAIETRGWGHLWGTYHAYRYGDPQRAEAHARQTLEIFEHIGGAFSRTWAWTMTGLAATMQGQWQQALDAIEQSRAIATDRHTAADTDGWAIVLEADAHLHLGDAARAIDLCRDGVALMRTRSQAQEAIGNVELARMLLASEGLGARQEIEAALSRAEDLVRSLGILAVKPAAHEQRAELARQLGDEPRHQDELQEAYRLFTQIGAMGHAERLQGTLAAFVS